MCHVITEVFKKDLNGAYNLVAARDTKKSTYFDLLRLS